MTEEQLAEFVAFECGVDPSALRLSATAIGGGLECDVRRVRVRVADGSCRWPESVVVKELRGHHRRELQVYRLLARVLPNPLAPQVLAVARQRDADYLVLADVPSAEAWPWAHTPAAAAVCRSLARLHTVAPTRARSIAWDFDSELQASAQRTLELAIALSGRGRPRYWRRLGDLRRVVAALPRMREVLSHQTALIHGDVHPGNVLLPTVGADPAVVLIDWGRARVGSPLEDVASWLQSLGAWEPQARRFHDTLLRAYLAARGDGVRLDRELRTRYVLAGASNGLAGAIRYHLWRASDPAVPESGKLEAARGLYAWQRLVRQAAMATRSL